MFCQPYRSTRFSSQVIIKNILHVLLAVFYTIISPETIFPLQHAHLIHNDPQGRKNTSKCLLDNEMLFKLYFYVTEIFVCFEHTFVHVLQISGLINCNSENRSSGIVQLLDFGGSEPILRKLQDYSYPHPTGSSSSS